MASLCSARSPTSPTTTHSSWRSSTSGRARRTFDQLRAQNAEGPKFRFIDGPVTANKSLAVHTAWGRTLKDVFLRYKALNGYHQRYQNGFDCQGLWIEVGVERQLGLNSKREIEEYGLAAFAKECRAVVEKSAAELTAGSIRLGQWMDWGNDYYTFSDTNIEYIWKFLKIVNERGWLFKGHRATEWCPRCGTSISAHELAGSYIDKEDPSLYVRFPLLDRPGEALVIWTTTPWTLPANVAAAVRPDLPYGRRANGDWVAAGTAADDELVETKLGAELVGWRYEGPFDTLTPGRRGRPPGHPVGRHLDRGGHRRRAHRAGLRCRGLRPRQAARPADDHAGRRDGPLLPGVRVARRPVDVRRRATTSSPTSRRGTASSPRARSTTASRSAGAATPR